MQDDIRSKIQKDYDAVILDKKTKNSLIQQGKNQAWEDFIKKLDA